VVIRRPIAFASVVAAALVVAASGAVAAEGSGQLRVGIALWAPTVGRDRDPVQYDVYRGLLRAKRDLRVQLKVLAPNPTRAGDQFFGLLSYLALQRCDLVIASGILEVPALSKAARKFPNVRFALLDGARQEVKNPPANIEGSVFHTEEPSYLAGYVAARMADRGQLPHVVSTVAGFPTPQVEPFLAGFRAGAKRADPKIRVLSAFTGDFVNKTKCKHAALAQIAQGSRVVFDVAGLCGLGALEAAKRMGAYGIGVDIDQSYLGKFILTSVVKNLNVGAYDLADRLVQGRLRTGGNLSFNLRNRGVGLGKFSPKVPLALRRELIPLATQIEQRKIVVPMTLSNSR